MRALKAAYRQVHEFWTDDVSLSDESLFDPAYITAARQVTDAYLLGLAARRKQRLVSFDRSPAVAGDSQRIAAANRNAGIASMAANERKLHACTCGLIIAMAAKLRA